MYKISSTRVQLTVEICQTILEQMTSNALTYFFQSLVMFSRIRKYMYAYPWHLYNPTSTNFQQSVGICPPGRGHISFRPWTYVQYSVEICPKNHGHVFSIACTIVLIRNVCKNPSTKPWTYVHQFVLSSNIGHMLTKLWTYLHFFFEKCLLNVYICQTSREQMANSPRTYFFQSLFMF